MGKKGEKYKMRSITTPLGLTAIIAIVIGLFNFTNIATEANLLGLFFILLLLTLFIHELGHALFAINAGYRFNYLTIGPITFENTDRFRIKRNDSWFLFGGVASCSPKSSDLTSIAKQHKLFVAGGPIFSIVAAIISLLVGISSDIDMFTYFGIFNLFIFLVTILPYQQGALKSDGRVLLELSKGGKQTEELLTILLLIKEMNSPIHPTNWSEDLIERAKALKPTVENATVGYILFYYTLLKEGYENASAIIEPYKQLPVTKQSKFALQFITHIRQIDLVLRGEADEASIDALHQLFSPIEPLSYKRSEAILAKVKGNEQLGARKLSEVLNEINKGKKQFGFYYAEEQLTHVLMNEIG